MNSRVQRFLWTSNQNCWTSPSMRTGPFASSECPFFSSVAWTASRTTCVTGTSVTMSAMYMLELSLYPIRTRSLRESVNAPSWNCTGGDTLESGPRRASLPSRWTSSSERMKTQPVAKARIDSRNDSDPLMRSSRVQDVVGHAPARVAEDGLELRAREVGLGPQAVERCASRGDDRLAVVPADVAVGLNQLRVQLDERGHLRRLLVGHAEATVLDAEFEQGVEACLAQVVGA